MRATRCKKNGLKEELRARLCELLDREWEDANLVDLIDTKVQLTLEIDKDESYWE